MVGRRRPVWTAPGERPATCVQNGAGRLIHHLSSPPAFTPGTGLTASIPFATRVPSSGTPSTPAPFHMDRTTHSSRRRPLALLAAVAGALAFAAPAAAAPAVATDTAMNTAESIARAQWGMDPCGGQVTVVWTVLAPQVNATSTWSNPIGGYADPAQNSGCKIEYNDLASWDWPKLCTVVVHEMGHLSGHDHSPDPNDVMSAYYTRPLAACDTPGPGLPPASAPAASTSDASSSAPAAPASSSTRSTAHKTHTTKTKHAKANKAKAKKARAKAKAKRARAKRARARKAREARARARSRAAAHDASAHRAAPISARAAIVTRVA
jgi:matrixin